MSATVKMKRGPGKREVRAALSRVLASQPLRSSPRLQRLLTFLVEEVLAGRGESLVQYRVATEGLGLGENFDPEKHTLVRSHAGRLRKALAAYYEGEGSADKIVITLPASGYRVGFVRVGSRAARGAKPAGLAPLLIVSRFQGIGLKGNWGALPASLAEELSLRLARAAHLRVAQGERAARRPDADFVLEGSIEQRGEKLLVRSRLLDAPGGVQIWSRRYEMSAARWDAGMFEDEIIDAIAVEVGSDFGKIDRHLIRHAPAGGDDDASLHSALLKTKAYESSCTEEAYDEAAAALRGVLEKSPASSTAHAMLGVLLLVGHCEYFRRKHDHPCEALEHLVLALAAEPNNAYARYGRVVDFLIRREYGELAALTDEILADEDFPPGFALLACFCRLYGRNATLEIRARAARLMRQNPEYPRIMHTAFALEHLLAGDHESARRDMAVAELPGNWFGPVVQMAIHHAAGRRSEAKAARKKLLELCPDYDRYGEEVLGRSLHPDFVGLLMAAYRAAA
jgi:TolB-like protein